MKKNESKWKIRNVDSGDLFLLDSPVISAGRETHGKIVCHSPLISRKHVDFCVLSDNSLRIADKDTTNGTYVNGIKIPKFEHYPLNHGDLICLGFDPKISSKSCNKGQFYTFKVLFNDDSDTILIDSDEEVENRESSCIKNDIKNSVDETDKTVKVSTKNSTSNNSSNNLVEKNDLEENHLRDIKPRIKLNSDTVNSSNENDSNKCTNTHDLVINKCKDLKENSEQNLITCGDEKNDRIIKNDHFNDFDAILIDSDEEADNRETSCIKNSIKNSVDEIDKSVQVNTKNSTSNNPSNYAVERNDLKDVKCTNTHDLVINNKDLKEDIEQNLKTCGDEKNDWTKNNDHFNGLIKNMNLLNALDDAINELSETTKSDFSKISEKASSKSEVNFRKDFSDFDILFPKLNVDEEFEKLSKKENNVQNKFSDQCSTVTTTFKKSNKTETIKNNLIIRSEKENNSSLNKVSSSDKNFTENELNSEVNKISTKTENKEINRNLFVKSLHSETTTNVSDNKCKNVSKKSKINNDKNENQKTVTSKKNINDIDANKPDIESVKSNLLNTTKSKECPSSNSHNNSVLRRSSVSGSSSSKAFNVQLFNSNIESGIATSSTGVVEKSKTKFELFPNNIAENKKIPKDKQTVEITENDDFLDKLKNKSGAAKNNMIENLKISSLSNERLKIVSELLVNVTEKLETSPSINEESTSNKILQIIEKSPKQTTSSKSKIVESTSTSVNQRKKIRSKSFSKESNHEEEKMLTAFTSTPKIKIYDSKHIKVNVERFNFETILPQKGEENKKTQLTRQNYSSTFNKIKEVSNSERKNSTDDTHKSLSSSKRKLSNSVDNNDSKHFKIDSNDNHTTKNGDLFFDTQELFSTLCGEDDLKADKNKCASKNDSELQSVKSEVKLGFTDDDVIIIQDDDEDDDNFPCSQLMQSSQEENINNDENNENAFMNIKKELEELDKIDYIPCVNLDSDYDSDWFSDLIKPNKTGKGSTNSERVVPQTYDNFDKVVDRSPKTFNRDEKDKNPSLTNEEPSCSRISPVNVEENSKSIGIFAQPITSYSFYSLDKNLSKKYVIPPIVEPHVHSRNRNNFKRENSDVKKGISNKNKKMRTSEGSPKTRTENECLALKKLKKIKKTSKKKTEDVLEVREKEYRRIQIRQKVKEITSKENVEKPKTSTSKHSAVKVKVSDSRGDFLLENNTRPVRRRQPKNITVPIPSIPKLSTSTHNSKDLATYNQRSILDEVEPSPARNVVRRRGANVKKVPNQVPTNVLPLPKNVISTLDVSDVINQVINWSASWLDQQKMNNSSPQVNKYPPTKMRPVFSSYNDYHTVVVPLLLLELWNALYKDWTCAGGDLRKKIFCSRIEDEKIANDCTVIQGLTYIDKNRNSKGITVKEEDLVVFECRGKHERKTIIKTGFGYVTNVNKRPTKSTDIIDAKVAQVLGLVPDFSVNFTLKTKIFTGSADKGSLMYIRVVSSMGPYLRLFKAVKYLSLSPLKPFILSPRVQDFKRKDVNLGKLKSTVKLNNSQLKAVQQATEMCLGQKSGIYLIQGPPGTGKTTVLTAIVQEILFRADDPSFRILLVAPSNGAVDELAKRLIQIREKMTDPKRKILKIVRVGPQKSIHPKVNSYSLDSMARKNFREQIIVKYPHCCSELISKESKITEVEKKLIRTGEGLKDVEKAKNEHERFCVSVWGKEYYWDLDKEKTRVLANANIICTTLSSCFSAQMESIFGCSDKINCCIVDEATQSNEQETLIPLMLGLNKLVLVGDPCQLTPTTLSHEAKQLNYGFSLFSRIHDRFKDHPDNPIVMLDTQYRMHPEISQLPRRWFYNNRLTDDVRCHTKANKNLQPYYVFSLSMYFPVEQYHNDHEVKFTLKLVDSIVDLTKEDPILDIGIITPYNNQKDILNDALKKKRDKLLSFKKKVSIVANTVDSFQGQEKDIIIVSCVRMDSNSFVADEHRLNVTLTRAKSALYIVGSTFLFETCPVLKKIRNDAIKRKILHVIDGNERFDDLRNIISSSKLLI